MAIVVSTGFPSGTGLVCLLLLRHDTGNGRIDPHLDLARHRLALLGQEDAQHAVAALRADVFQVHCRGQREAADEGSDVTTDAVIVLPPVGVLELALAAQYMRDAI